MLRDADAAVRWWGALGHIRLGAAARPAAAALAAALADPSPDVRLAAAEALAGLGQLDRALEVIAEALRADDGFARLSALSLVARLGTRARPLIPAIRAATYVDPANKDVTDYISRMVGYLPGRISE